MKPYSQDLRERIYGYSLTHTIAETAKTFKVSPNTVTLLRRLHNETGSLTPRPSSREYSHLITPTGEIYLGLLLASEVDLTIDDLIEYYENQYHVRVSIGTMFNTLKKLNFTRKKKTFSDPKKTLLKKKFTIKSLRTSNQKIDFI